MGHDEFKLSEVFIIQVFEFLVHKSAKNQIHFLGAPVPSAEMNARAPSIKFAAALCRASHNVSIVETFAIVSERFDQFCRVN